MLSGIPLFPGQTSSPVSEADKLYFFITAVTALFALLVVICVIVFAIKDHDRTGERVGAPSTGSIPLELAWSIVPFVISMAIFAWTTVVFFELVRPPVQTLEIHSTSKRWIWPFQHIGGRSHTLLLHVAGEGAPPQAHDHEIRGSGSLSAVSACPHSGRARPRDLQLLAATQV